MKTDKISRKATSAFIGAITVSALVAVSSSAFAAATAPGSVCQPAHHPITGYGGGTVVRYFGGVAMGGPSSGDNLVDCPVTNGSSMGSDIRFRISVTDNSSVEDSECYGFVRDLGGNTTVTTAPVSSSGTGDQILDVSVPSPSGLSTSTLSYSVLCTIPDPNAQFISSINEIRVD